MFTIIKCDVSIRNLYIFILLILPSGLLSGQAVADPYFGLQVGGTWSLIKPDGVEGRVALPTFGLHGVFSIDRRIKLRSYLEYQRFSIVPSSTLLSGDGPTAALTGLLMIAFQMPGSSLGGTYIALGGGLGLHPSFSESLGWVAVSFGSEFGRKYFAEIRMQFKAGGGGPSRIFEMGIAVFEFGVHLNPRPMNWKESLLEEKR